MVKRNKKTVSVVSRYEKIDFEKLPKTYTDASFLEKIYKASGLEKLRMARVADLMSGPGKVGLGIQGIIKTSQRHHWLFIDLVRKQLEKIPRYNDRVEADCLKMPFSDNVFDVVIARYSIKDITAELQPSIVSEVYRCTKKSGIFVIADMVAPNQYIKKWLNKQHGLKQQFGGRNPTVDGECNILTESELVNIVSDAGFNICVYARHISHVRTRDWFLSNQVNQPQLKLLNSFILNASKYVKSVFNIRKEKNGVKIDYPVVITRAVK